MTFFSKAVLLMASTAFAGCDILDSLGQISDANDDRPYFAYTLDDFDNTDVYLATITAERKGLLRDAVEIEFGRGDISVRQFSPSQAYLEVGYFQDLSNGEFDVGFNILDVEARSFSGGVSDNVVSGYLERNCASELAATAQVGLDLYASSFGRTLTLVSLEYQDYLNETNVGGAFWVSDDWLVVRYRLTYAMNWVDEVSGETGFLPFDPGERREIGGHLDMRRDILGRLQFRGCGSEQTRPPVQIETAVLAAPDRVLSLDGVPLDNVLTPGTPLETRPVLGVTKWTFPF